MIDPESVLDRSRIDLGRHAAVVGESGAVDTGTRPVFDELDRSTARRLAFAARDEDPNLVLALGQPFLEGTANRRCNTAGVPVEAEYAAEGLKPMWVRQPAQEFGPAMLQNHHLSNSRSKLSHTLEKPLWSSAGMKRKCSA